MLLIISLVLMVHVFHRNGDVTEKMIVPTALKLRQESVLMKSIVVSIMNNVVSLIELFIK